MHKLKGAVFFVILLIVAFAQIGFSATEDFQYTAPSNIEACACSGFAITGEIINIGDVHSHYFVSDFGTASPWTKAVPEYFSMPAGDKKTLTTFISVPCNAAAGQYTLYIKIASSLGLEKVHAANLNIKKCDIINVVPVKTKREVCAGDVAIYEFRIENQGPFSEKIMPSVSKLSQYSQFNFDSYIVNSLESEPAYLYISSMREIGTYNINVSFTASRSGFRYTVPISYTAVDCRPRMPAEESGFLAGFLLMLSEFNWLLILLWIAGILLLLLIILFIVLLFKAITKKRADKTLKQWVEAADEKPKEKKIVAAKKSEKQIKPAKKISPKDKKKLKKIVAWILLILLILLFLGLFLWGLMLLRPFMPETDWNIMNRTRDFFSNITLGAEEPINETLLPIINETEKDVVNETLINESVYPGVRITDPISAFFGDYARACGFMVAVFFLLFVFSLFLLRLKPKNKWNNKKKILLKCFKYSIPAIFFVFMVFSAVFCVFNNMPEESWPGRCSIVRVDCPDGLTSDEINITAENINATQLMEDDSITVEKLSLPRCFCQTLFGTSIKLWSCFLLLILLILLIFFIIWLIIMIPIWLFLFKKWRDKRKEQKRKKREELKTKKEAERKEKLAKQKKEEQKKAKMAAAAEKAKPKKDSAAGSILKDIILLLILLFLLFLIGWYFYSSSFLADDVEDEEMVNETIIPEEPEPEDEVLELPVIEANMISHGMDLRCVTTFDDTEADIKLSELDELEMTFSWYVSTDGEEYLLLIDNQETDILSNELTNPGDILLCNAIAQNESVRFSVNSTPLMIVGSKDDVISDDIEYIVIEKPDPLLEEINNKIDYIIENHLEESFRYLIMQSGERVEVDLNRYFIDPDGDELFFSVDIDSEDVSIDIWKGIASIKAQSEFIGIVNATFSAEDPYGGKVSADMIIVVKPADEKQDFWNNYKDTILLAGLIAIVLFVFLFFAGKGKQKKKKDIDPDDDVFKNF